jgi:serine/threonine-protein kinase
MVVKRIWPELAHDPDFIAMFLDEAGLCARMDHANVVRTHEVGRDGEQLYIAMEYLRGRSLRQVSGRLAPQGGLSLALQISVLADVLAGLEYAHELKDERGAPLGIVHRDVSPQNVFVTYGGAVKLVDFGIAKSVAASHRTRPGVMKGRLAYMAPEQMRAAASVDRRADLFSVGVMLWEAAAGRRLWQDLPEAAIVGRLLSGPAIPPPLGPGRLPTGLLRVCRRALALDPAGRYLTASEFRHDLLALLKAPAEALASELGHTVSAAFAEERAAMDEVARRGVEEELSASGVRAADGESPAPATSLTESVLRPFEAAPAWQAPRRSLVPGRLAVWALLAAGAGFGAIRLSLRAPAPAQAEHSVAPAPPTFQPAPNPPPAPSPAPPPEAVAVAPAPAVTDPMPSAPAISAPTISDRAPSARATKYRRARAPRAVISAPASTPELAAPMPRQRSIDLDNPYQP